MTFPGTASARRGHVPQPPSGTLPDPGGASAAQRAYRQHQQAADLYARWKHSFPPGISADELQDSQGLFAYSEPAWRCRTRWRRCRRKRMRPTSGLVTW
jgi:hypothetical protein